jgi:acetyl-CoA carboxylase carboxyltransferase component/acetyl/propionyl-CoA carboxylase alpha subunit
MDGLKSLLVANRGEVAIRIFRAAAELGIRTVAIFSADDANSLHTRRADDAVALKGSGAAAYIDAENIIAIANAAGCDSIHPGCGLLSESAQFARRCADVGLKFVGPRSETLEELGDKVRARAIAARCGVPILPGKRDVHLERMIARARHIEVQIIGDGSGAVAHLWERECSIQRRNQKIVEIAPSPGLELAMRERLTQAAARMARELRYASLGAFGFLVFENGSAMNEAGFAFIEANPRLQAGHTVTEEVSGVDLVKAQLRLAGGASLKEVRLEQVDISEPRGFAIQLRINPESIGADGTPRPATGTLTAFEAPSGPGIRVDTAGYSGYATNPSFDSILAKLIAHSPSSDYGDVVRRAYRALCEFRIEGVATNIEFLQNLLQHPDFAANRIDTHFVEDHIAELTSAHEIAHRRLYIEAEMPRPVAPNRRAGAKLDSTDPLAVLEHGKSGGGAPDSRAIDATARSENTVAVNAPIQGTIVSVDIRVGEAVRRGQQLLVMEAMKMEHVIAAPVTGIVREITVAIGDTVFEGHPLALVEEREVEASEVESSSVVDLDCVRPDLSEVHERHLVGLDAARPQAVARRRKTGQRTARENIEDLCDAGTFVEFGPLVIAAQRRRRTIEDLVKNTPADGLVTGLGCVNGDLFEPARSRCIVMSYDYTVLAGTQGHQNHRKKDRMFQIAREQRLPLILFAEGGGGRPGDTDGGFHHSRSFHDFPKLSGLVPLVGITSGRCYAGNASLLGCCDVVIATANSNIGMGGPAMIEGGGLGIFRPEEIGAMDVQVPNGVVDIAVRDEAEAVRAAKKYISYFQGPVKNWECADQRELRGIIPENRLRVYDVHQIIDTLADTGSVLELRREYGPTMITSLIRVEGRPLGLVANNPKYLAGAIDSDGSDKGAHFIRLCDAFDIPLLFLCDTPGIMVGPEIEKTALVRHSSRLFLTAANATVPLFTIVLRKAYGLGGIAMAAGSYDAPLFTVAWPTGEFGPMGLEGAVKLGYRNELAAIAEPAERKQRFDEMVATMYQRGKALNNASQFGVDDVIDPADSRRWIATGLRASPPPEPRIGKKHGYVDSW